jgi:hypothetical protein
MARFNPSIAPKDSGSPSPAGEEAEGRLVINLAAPMNCWVLEHNIPEWEEADKFVERAMLDFTEDLQAQLSEQLGRLCEAEILDEFDISVSVNQDVKLEGGCWQQTITLGCEAKGPSVDRNLFKEIVHKVIEQEPDSDTYSGGGTVQERELFARISRFKTAFEVAINLARQPGVGFSGFRGDAEMSFKSTDGEMQRVFLKDNWGSVNYDAPHAQIENRLVRRNIEFMEGRSDVRYPSAF